MSSQLWRYLGAWQAIASGLPLDPRRVKSLTVQEELRFLLFVVTNNGTDLLPRLRIDVFGEAPNSLASMLELCQTNTGKVLGQAGMTLGKSWWPT